MGIQDLNGMKSQLIKQKKVGRIVIRKQGNFIKI